MISATCSATAGAGAGRRQEPDVRRTLTSGCGRSGRPPARPSACGPPGWRSGGPCRRRSPPPPAAGSRSSVRPVAVRSTIPSTRPVSGASSTEPLTSTISAWRPLSAKWAAATRGYLVAMRTRPRRRRASLIGSPPSRAATTMRQSPYAQVQQLVDLATGLLQQHVLAGDADVGRAVLDVGGHVAGPHRHDAGVGEQQLALVGADLAGIDPDAVQQIKGALEQRTARHGDGQAVAHASASSAAWARCTRCTSRARPQAGRSRPKRLSSSS